MMNRSSAGGASGFLNAAAQLEVVVAGFAIMLNAASIESGDDISVAQCCGTRRDVAQRTDQVDQRLPGRSDGRDVKWTGRRGLWW